MLPRSSDLMLLVGFVGDVARSCLSDLRPVVCSDLPHQGWIKVDLRKFSDCFEKTIFGK